MLFVVIVAVMNPVFCWTTVTLIVKLNFLSLCLQVSSGSVKGTFLLFLLLLLLLSLCLLFLSWCLSDQLSRSKVTAAVSRTELQPQVR